MTQTERIVLEILMTPDLSPQSRTLPRLISRTGLERNTLLRALRGLEARDLIVSDVDATPGTSVWYTRPQA